MLTDAEIAARYVKIRPYLDERQRRLWLGVEAQALGTGGVAVVARGTGADVKTVRRGTAEIESGAEPGGRLAVPAAGGLAWRSWTPGWCPRWRRWSIRQRGATRCRRCAGRRSRPPIWPAS